jgi:hypothetical protein
LNSSNTVIITPRELLNSSQKKDQTTKRKYKINVSSSPSANVITQDDEMFLNTKDCLSNLENSFKISNENLNSKLLAVEFDLNFMEISLKMQKIRKRANFVMHLNTNQHYDQELNTAKEATTKNCRVIKSIYIFQRIKVNDNIQQPELQIKQSIIEKIELMPN